MLIAYNGTPFRGWQSQLGGNTVQDHLEAAFRTLCGTRIPVHGSGRTDTGVHATGQVAHVDLVNPRRQYWPAAINAHLPNEIRVMEWEEVPADFHARFSAKGKVYTYRIYHGPVQCPFELNRSWHIPTPLNLPMLIQCANLLIGTHDYAGFAANRGKPEKDTVRTISRIEVDQTGPIITLTFEGTGFLYKMVRLLTGSLIRCAQHREHPEWLEQILAREKRTSFAAYAHGLYLSRVIY